MKLDLVGRVHHVIAAEACTPWAEELSTRHPNHFRYHKVHPVAGRRKRLNPSPARVNT
jgi:hypothetical protein